jgi:hypothetical protein
MRHKRTRRKPSTIAQGSWRVRQLTHLKMSKDIDSCMDLKVASIACLAVTLERTW